MATISEGEKKKLQHWIKRTYWDYLCAQRLLSKSLREINKIFSVKIPEELLKQAPNFNDFEFEPNPSIKASDIDPRFGHIKSPAPMEWLQWTKEMRFKTGGFSPIIGNAYDVGIAIPNDEPINGKRFYLDPNFACRYIGKTPVTIHDLNVNNVLRGFKAIALLRNTLSHEEFMQARRSVLFYQCFLKQIYEDHFHTLTQYTDFTMCSIVERIRRYYRNVYDSNIFAKNTDPTTLSLEERNLRDVAQIRDIYFAHNMHYPPTPEHPIPTPFSYGYKNGNIYLKNIFYSMDRGDIQKRLEKAVMAILNTGASEEEKFHTPQELEAHLALNFPDFSKKRNGPELAYTRLVRCISAGVSLKFTTQKLYGMESKNVPILLELSGAESPGAGSSGSKFRDLALHDHFPYEEFYGDVIMRRADVAKNGPNPRNMRRADRIGNANMSLIEAALNGQMESLIQQTSAIRQAKAAAAQKKKRKGGR